MLLPFTIIIRRSASEPPTRSIAGIETRSIARVEGTDTPRESLLYVDGRDTPYRVDATVEEVIGAVHYIYQREEAEQCEPEPCGTE